MDLFQEAETHRRGCGALRLRARVTRHRTLRGPARGPRPLGGDSRPRPCARPACGARQMMLKCWASPAPAVSPWATAAELSAAELSRGTSQKTKRQRKAQWQKWCAQRIANPCTSVRFRLLRLQQNPRLAAMRAFLFAPQSGGCPQICRNPTLPFSAFSSNTGAPGSSLLYMLQLGGSFTGGSPFLMSLEQKSLAGELLLLQAARTSERIICEIIRILRPERWQPPCCRRPDRVPYQ